MAYTGYSGYTGETGDDRRLRRHGYVDPEQEALNQSLESGAYYGTGYGSPESGYGPGGVENPAYRGGGGGVSTTMPVGERTELPGGGGSTGGGVTPTIGDRDSLKYSNVGQMNGFNTGDYGGDVKARNSVKNTFGRIASRYEHKPSSLKAIMADPEFQKYFPNARLVEGGAGDKIDFGGVLSDFESGVPVGVVDVMQAADPNADSSMGWAWMDEANGGGGMPGGGGGGGASFSSGGVPLDVEGTLAAAGANQAGALERYLAMLHGNQLFNPEENFMLRRGM